MAKTKRNKRAIGNDRNSMTVAELNAITLANADPWTKEMAAFITSEVLGDVHTQLALCGRILNSPVFESVPFAVTALCLTCSFSDVSDNGEVVAKMAEEWGAQLYERFKATEGDEQISAHTATGDILQHFESYLTGSFGTDEHDQELLRITLDTLREAVACSMALGCLGGFEYANRRMHGATENLRRAAVEAKLVAA